METSQDIMLQIGEDDAIQTWSEDKRKDFTHTFEQRAASSQYIMLCVADLILRGAQRKHFISDKHINEAKKEMPATSPIGVDPVLAKEYYYNLTHGYPHSNIGGRTSAELQQIAEKQAEAVLAELPPLKQAVQILDAETAKKIDQKEKLKDKCQKLVDQIKAESEPIVLEELDPKMPLAEALKMIKDRNKLLKKLRAELTEASDEGAALEDQINKKLYKGLPGLSEAVMQVAIRYHQRAVGLSEVTRRVGEKVMFGDSDAALSLLHGFEKDEATIDSDVKAEFGAAMQKLQLTASKRTVKKALPSRSK